MAGCAYKMREMNDPNHSQYIELLKQGYSVDQIAYLFHKFPETILASLIEKEIPHTVYAWGKPGENAEIAQAALDAYNNNTDMSDALRIDDDRILLIADTHIGRFDINLDGTKPYDENKPRLLKNEEALYNAYDFARNNGIKTILHLGDAIQGSTTVDCENLLTLRCQEHYLQYIYPYIEGIDTYLLYGNHDYNAIRFFDKGTYEPKCVEMREYNYPDNPNYTPGDSSTSFFYHNDFYLQQLLSYKNVHVIGNYFAPLYFCGDPILAIHDNPYLHCLGMNIPDYDVILKLYGHSHKTGLDGIRFDLASLAPTKQKCDLGDVDFTVLRNEGNEFLFQIYDQNKKLVDERALTKIRKTVR